MTAPYQPSNVILQTGNQKTLVTWNLSIGATSYNVQRSTDGVNFITVGTSNGNSYLDSTVLVGVAYYYQVAAVNGANVSAYSATYPVSITPCLPGQCNLGYLRYQAQLRSDKLNSQYLTMDEWNININQSMKELGDILTTKFGDNYFLAPPLIIPLTGLEYYPLPDGSNYPNALGVPAPAMYKISGVSANISGAAPGPNAGWVPLPRFNWSDREKYTTFPGQAGALNNIFQMAYREMGQNLHLIPSNQNQLIKVWYVPILPDLLADTDMLVFGFNGWWEYIIDDCAMKAMVKEESLEKWTALAQNKAQLIERIETTAANRDVDQINSVSNTRQTVGDPGFSNFNSGVRRRSFWGRRILMKPLSSKIPWELMNPILAQSLNPILANAILSGEAIIGISLPAGVLTFGHGLGRLMQGFWLTDINAAAVIFRSQPMNDKTLTLTSSAACICNLWVY
jgi:hypothetical protein